MLRIKANLNGRLEFKEDTISIAKGMLTVSDSQNHEVFNIKTKDIEKAFVEEGVGICKLIVKTKDGKEKEVAYFTKSKVKNFRKFTDAINQYAIKNRMVNTTFEEKPKAQGSIGTLLWLYGYAQKHKKILIVGTIFSLIAVAVNLIPPYLLKVLIDNVLLSKTHSEQLFLSLTLILVASYAASAVVSTIQSYMLNMAGNRILKELRSKLFKHAVKLSATDIDSISVSRIQSRLISDAGYTQWLLANGLGIVITSVLTIVGIGVILFLLFPKLALYVLIPIPFIIAIIINYNKDSDRAYHRAWRRSSDLITKIDDAIPNYTVVKSATKEDFESEEFNRRLGKYYDTQIDINRMELTHWQPVGFLITISTVIIWWVGGNLVIVGTLQLGIVTAFLAYMALFFGPIQQLSTSMPFMQECITSAQRLREVFDSAEAPNEPRGTKKPDLTNDITFRKLWFGYDPLFPVIKGMDATIKRGKVTAVVGKSGAGKSTIAKLLLGLYKLDEGDIKFGGTSINNIDINYLRGHISYVPQDSSFFDNSVAYNISYFSRTGNIAPLDMIATTKAVEMHEEIMKLPLCYDNRIRGRGTSLSGGQRQRLAVARAILGNPDVVVLDEITSALDVINARKVNKAVLKLESDKTMVVVTHDFNEVVNADYVVVLDDGKVAEYGAPSKLLRKKGKLHEMFKYKLGSASMSRAKVKKNSLQSFVKGYVVSESKVSVSEGDRKSFVDVKYENKKAVRIVPKRPFPVSDSKFIIFYSTGKHDRDIFAIEDYTKLDQKSREIPEGTLEVNGFNPRVIAIKAIRITGDGLVWDLVTDKGDMKFTTKNRQDIVTKDRYVILIDEFNTPLKIEMKDLDKSSVDVLEHSV